MNKYPDRFWMIVLLIGWLFDFLFWRQSVGVNFAIIISITLLAGYYLLMVNEKKPAFKSLWLLVPLAFFAMLSIFRREPLTLFLAYTLSLFSLSVLANTYLGGSWMQYGLSDYFTKSLQLIGSMIATPIEFYLQTQKEQAERGEVKAGLPILPVLRGLVLTVPVVAFFAFLLASADMIFNQKLVELFGSFDSGRIAEYFLRLFIVLFWEYVLAGTFLHVAKKSADENQPGDGTPKIKTLLGFTESAIVLGSVVILFLLFVIIQFRYFFGGNLNIGIQAFTYSQYARRGFNELVIVAFFSLVMILGLSNITKRENTLQRRIFSGLNIAMVVLVLIILVSAYQRLVLAIDWHGFSRLRLYPQVFLVWVGILFVAVAFLEILHQERYFAFAAVLASLGFAVSLGLFNVDDAIVRHNVLRASQGRHFNPVYLATLSTDAVPALADEFLDGSLSISVHEGIGAALLCQLNSGAFSMTSDADWRSFNFSLWHARSALAGVEGQLEGYRLIIKRVPFRVRTPGNNLYECAGVEPNSGD